LENALDGVARMQRRIRILKHHLRLAGERLVAPPFGRRSRQDVDDAVSLDGAGERLQDRAFPGTGLTDKTEAFATGGGKGDVPDHLRRAEGDAEVVDLDGGSGGALLDDGGVCVHDNHAGSRFRTGKMSTLRSRGG